MERITTSSCNDLQLFFAGDYVTRHPGSAHSAYLSGINAVIYYAPQIFLQAGFDNANTQMLATVGVGTVNLLTTVLAMFLIDRIGRRPLLILGFAGSETAP